MSYSFSVKGVTKADAVERVAAQLANVFDQQPVHAADKDQALAAAEAFVGLLPDPAPDEDVNVYMAGSVGGVWEGSAITRLTSASVNVQAGLVKKEA